MPKSEQGWKFSITLDPRQEPDKYRDVLTLLDQLCLFVDSSQKPFRHVYIQEESLEELTQTELILFLSTVWEKNNPLAFTLFLNCNNTYQFGFDTQKFWLENKNDTSSEVITLLSEVNYLLSLLVSAIST